MAQEDKDNGLALGGGIPSLQLTNWNGEAFNICELQGPVAYIFVSLYCERCVDLLPHLTEIQQKYPFNYVLLTNGSEHDHREMADYFQWDCYIATISIEDMERHFNVSHTPCVIYADSSRQVAAKGIIYEAIDFERLIAAG
ncbi:hypothetical protein EBB07_26165 [Paenibacillaceae bacterium]|nr:hypothetical protein EBB07_26165 [Paenibacillaceae bacterium]